MYFGNVAFAAARSTAPNCPFSTEPATGGACPAWWLIKQQLMYVDDPWTAMFDPRTKSAWQSEGTKAAYRTELLKQLAAEEAKINEELYNAFNVNTVIAPQVAKVTSGGKGATPLRSLQIALALSRSVLAQKKAARSNMRSGSTAADLLDSEINALELECVSLSKQIDALNSPVTVSTPQPSTVTSFPVIGSGGGNLGNTQDDPNKAKAAQQAIADAAAAAEEVKKKQAAAEAEAARLGQLAELERLRSTSIVKSDGGSAPFVIGLGFAIKYFFF